MPSAPKLSLKQLKALDPCKKRYKRMKKVWPKGEKLNARQAVELGATFDDLAWAADRLSQKDKVVRRRYILWRADCDAIYARNQSLKHKHKSEHERLILWLSEDEPEPLPLPEIQNKPAA